MSDRDTEIVKAASELFMRYGIGRVTMADIAKGAGVARQTLYNAYANKDDVLRAVARNSVATTFAAVEKPWADAADIAICIDLYYEHVPLAWFDMVVSAPDAAEIVDGLNAVAKSEMDEAMAKWRTMFAAKFTTAGAADPDTMADFFVSASKSAKYDAIDRTTLVKRLEMLKQAVLAMLPSA